ncbi:MAG: hypothetical protein JXQ90_02550 [Cyclobacteriaceae bacterium]
MKIKQLVTVFSMALFAGAFIWSCSRAHEPSNAEKVRAATEKVTYDISSKKLLDEEGMKVLKTQIEGLNDQFLIPERAKEITSHPCSNCHDQDIETLKAENKGAKGAHWHVEIVHADFATMNCATCHNMDRPDVLTSLSGKPIDFNHSYKQCSQCHSTQYKDWKGGAHGKSLAGWVPPRVSQTCVGCHNPHQPAFEKRWPSRLNTVKLNAGEKH